MGEREREEGIGGGEWGERDELGVIGAVTSRPPRTFWMWLMALPGSCWDVVEFGWCRRGRDEGDGKVMVTIKNNG